MAGPPSAPPPGSPLYLRRQAPCPQCSWGMEEKAAASAGCPEPPGPPRAAAVPCFVVSVDQDDILPGALRLIQELRPHWKPEQVRTKVAKRARGPGWGPAGARTGIRGRLSVHPSGCRSQGHAAAAQARLKWWCVCACFSPFWSQSKDRLPPSLALCTQHPSGALGTPEIRLPTVSAPRVRAPPPVAACWCPSLPRSGWPAHSETGGRNFQGNPRPRYTHTLPLTLILLPLLHPMVGAKFPG